MSHKTDKVRSLVLDISQARDKNFKITPLDAPTNALRAISILICYGKLKKSVVKLH